MGAICKMCGETKPDGGRCRICQRVYMRNWRKRNPEKSRAQRRRWRKRHPLKKEAQRERWRKNSPSKWRELRKRASIKWRRTTVRGVLNSSLASKRRHPIGVSVDDLVDLWESHNGCCAITGVPMVLDVGSLKKVSIDRIDNSKGYAEGNIQLICKWVNLAKNSSSNEEFLEILSDLRSCCR